METEAKKVVCVTGAGGFIASWIVKLLLLRGHTVRGTVRNPGRLRKPTLPIQSCSTDQHQGKFREYTSASGSGIEFISANCQMHASIGVAELIEPAVKGTLNVLASCKKASSVKRVILTSSMAAVVFTENPLSPGVVVDEKWFSVPELCEKAKEWYVLSKTLAEQAAWKFSEDNGIALVTINPAMVLGPLLQPTLNTSAEIIKYLINGSPVYLNISFGWVNVKGVALAYVLACEVPSASGRYCMVDRVIHFSEVVKIIHEMYPSLPVPEKCADDQPLAPTYQVSRDKIKSLGIELTPFETTLRETIESLKEKGLVSF
ncbi:hypothetical protein ACQ4PT_019609 [Festuca glaucescens]